VDNREEDYDYDYDYDDGNQPPRWKDAPRRSHDDGFDEYDGPDECEETDSQAANRRQEMAENAERQMEEAVSELNRAVFEHNSVPTEDPHIRISHLSPIVNR
jgi:hypothetical protein